MANDNVVKHSLDVSKGSLPEGYKCRLNLEIDYTGLLQWATSNRVIALQRNLRTLPTKTLNEMSKNGYRVHARDCGKKIVSRDQRIDDVVDTWGVSREVATIMVDDPGKLSELMSKVANK